MSKTFKRFLSPTATLTFFLKFSKNTQCFYFTTDFKNVFTRGSKNVFATDFKNVFTLTSKKFLLGVPKTYLLPTSKHFYDRLQKRFD